jgi:hypothetical protein
VLKNTGALDAGRRLRVEVATSAGEDASSSSSYRFEDDVEGVSGQRLANRASVVVHPASLYVGLGRRRSSQTRRRGSARRLSPSISTAPRGLAATCCEPRRATGRADPLGPRRCSTCSGAVSRCGAARAIASTSARGRPRGGEVTLWAMDAGLLSLTNYSVPDVARAVYARKALQVQTQDNRARLIGRPSSARPLPGSTALDSAVVA